MIPNGGPPVLPLLLTLTASGRDHPAAILPAADDNEDGLTLVIGGELSAPPVALVSGQPIALLDDGTAPDVIAEDGVYSGWAPLDSAADHQELTVTLQDHEGTVLWEDAIPAGDTQSRPLVKVLVSDRYAAVQVGFQDRAVGVEAPPPAGKPISRPAPPTPPSGLLTTGLVAAIALVTGGLLGMRVQRRRQRTIPLTPVRPPSGGVSTPEVWQISADVALSEVVTALATAWLESGPVLLVPQADSRPALSPQGQTGMAWMSTDRPQTRHIVRAMSDLSILGTPAVVIEGLDALEEPVEDEPPDALLDEIQQQVSGRVVVLVHEGTPLRSPPTCTFTLIEGRLDGATGRFERRQDGWHWLPAPRPTETA